MESVDSVHKEERDVANVDQKKRFAKASSIACLWSFLISLTGGLMLVLWELKFHPTSCQLWMVPVGLILFITPAMCWVAIIVSGFHYSTEATNLKPGSVCCL